MKGEDRRKMMNLADTIEGEINRMCVTHEFEELDTMYTTARANLMKLWQMKADDLKEVKK